MPYTMAIPVIRLSLKICVIHLRKVKLVVDILFQSKNLMRFGNTNKSLIKREQHLMRFLVFVFVYQTRQYKMYPDLGRDAATIKQAYGEAPREALGTLFTLYNLKLTRRCSSKQI